jgi:hypothetical protein
LVFEEDKKTAQAKRQLVAQKMAAASDAGEAEAAREM